VASHREIERKFLVKELPEGWRHASSSRIVQGYFQLTDRTLEIRLRRKANHCCLTFKAGQGRNRLEEEISITKAQFRALWPLTQRARIAKRRYQIPWNGCTIELDVYKGPHRGLITAEVEFKTERQSSRFSPPAWFGREVTRSGHFSNARLARSHRLPIPAESRKK
jgi:adenylate cyclase